MDAIQMEHVAMYVQDLESAVEFFERWLGAVPGQMYHNARTGFRSCFLSFGGGCRLELMSRPNMVDAAKLPTRTGYNHVAFRLGSREAVDTLTERLHAAGYTIMSGPRTTGDGYYESCAVAVEGNLIELTV